ncbi:MAG: hypothetical protein V2I54_12030 [Bacteroidales bacterium]|jgi:hypothetical protein|nr:hypothetical protein [Bacteroidales bacterium]
MKISGFTMGKNVDKLYYPIEPAIRSILPIVDEFVVALGKSDEDDKTREKIERINSPKIKIIDTVWDLEKYPNGMENAHQTDIAKSHCSGDWLFYLQADEVIHEKYLPLIKQRCQELLGDKEVEGLLFRYKHFWGDYNHYHTSHKWYKNEIRIIRNDPEIHSWESAQSFRRIPDFDGIHYRQQEGTYKLKVAKVDAEVYHYGWVRPPSLMKKKMRALDTIHKGESGAEKKSRFYRNFDYGPLSQLKEFQDTHPEVMKDWINSFDWADEMQYSGKPSKTRKKHAHERLKYRLVTWIEQNLLGGKSLGGFKNYTLLDR